MKQGTLRSVVVGLSLLALPVLAGEKGESSAAVARPPAPLEQLKLFLGTWKCAGKQLATPMFGPEHTFSAAVSARPEADGFWQQFTYEEKRSNEHRGLKMVGLWGYDVGGKRFIRAAASNESEWDSATSVGWSGGKMVWTGDLSGPRGRMPFRQIFTKKGDKEWSFHLELNVQGAWVPLHEVTCTAGKK